MSADIPIVYSTKAIRTFGFGYLSVVIALFLAQSGFSPAQIGALFSATLLEDALFTAFVSTLVTRAGAKPVLIASSLFIVLAGAGLGLGADHTLLSFVIVLGVISPAGFEGGPFSALEQAILPRTIRPEHLARAFSWYNLAGFGAAAAGALAAGIWVEAARKLGVSEAEAYRQMFLLYAAGGVLLTFLYACLPSEPRATAKVKDPASGEGHPLRFGLGPSKKPVLELAGLFAVDSLGGGFIVQGLLSYWFHIRYQAPAASLGPLFFATNLLAAASFLLAPYIAKRFGLLRTMVFTHLPCSIMLMLIPLMPTFELAAAVLIGRSLLSSMDIPTRQAYTMLLVAPEERPVAAGLTNSTRAVAQSLAPVLAGVSMSTAAIGLPFYVAGALKSFYDLALYFRFRHVKLPNTAGADLKV